METPQYYKLLEARFDRVAQVYDAIYGPPNQGVSGSALMGWLRQHHLDILRGLFPEGAALLDIGCGTGEEALALVQAGYSVLGLDLSPAMVRQAQIKAAVYGLRRGLNYRALPAGRLDELDERGPFQGAYASLGTLNTEPELSTFACQLHALLEPGAPFVAMVMSRHCAYEILSNFFRFKPGETLRRAPDWQENRAGTGGVVAPVKYYSPSEFAAAFAPYFTVESVCAFPLWLPPVHKHHVYQPDSKRFQRLESWNHRMCSWPGFRAWGDHFLMVLRRIAEPVPEQL